MCEPATTFEPEAPAELELAHIFRQFGAELGPLTFDQFKVVRAITDCRTAALGGHIDECDHCGHRETAFNSCLNRHCPKCQALKQARWLEARQADLLPVEYFHVVFTIPDVLHPIFLANREVCYTLLFAAVAETLKEVALRPERLGARIGFSTVLHTWTQKLLYHPHLHCVVPGGGLSPDGSRWLPCKPGFFLPVRVLSRVFRGKLLSKLETQIQKGELWLPPKDDPTVLLQEAARKDWVVYSKAPSAGPDQVLRYLGRYTHRIAISNTRLVALKDRKVTFRWKDRSDSNKSKLLTLDAVQFLSRFLLHVLPRGFVRIRHYGLLASACREKSLALCREHLNVDEPTAPNPDSLSETWDELLLRLTGIDAKRCPVCPRGRLVGGGETPPIPSRWAYPGRATSP